MKTFVLLFMATIFSVGKCTSSEKTSALWSGRLSVKDTTGRTDIQKFLLDRKSLTTLNFPNTTKRLYQGRDFNFSWFNSWEKQQNLWDARMTLDCVKHVPVLILKQIQ